MLRGILLRIVAQKVYESEAKRPGSTVEAVLVLLALPILIPVAFCWSVAYRYRKARDSTVQALPQILGWGRILFFVVGFGALIELSYYLVTWLLGRH